MPHNNAMRTMTNPYLPRMLLPWLMLLILCMGALNWAKTAPLANLSLAADSLAAHARNALPLLENLDFGMKGASGASVDAKGSATAADAGTTTFKTSHYAPRLEAAGVNVAHAEAQIAEAVKTMQSSMVTNAPVSGRMTIDGILVEYRATLLPNGTVNVGTIFPVKP
jgi:hypothetical protein